MKLSTKLILSYLAMAFLVVLIGAGSWLLNNSIRDKLILSSQDSIVNMQWVSDLEFHLQNSLLFTRNYLFERSREKEEPDRGVQLKSRNAEQEVRENLNQVSESLNLIRSREKNYSEAGTEYNEKQAMLIGFADSLHTSFGLYRSLINEIFEMEDMVQFGDEMFNLTIEPYFRTTLLQLLDEYRTQQNDLVDLQMASLKIQAERNTRIIAIITSIAFILASCLAWLVYHSISRPLNHLALATEEIGAGNFSKRIPIRTNDELGMLAESFNKMAANLNNSMVSRKYVNNIIQSMGDMLIVTNSEYEIQLINRSITESLQYEQNELIGEKIWILIRDEHEAYLKKHLSLSSQKKGFETDYISRDGGEIPVIVSFSRLEEAEDEPAGIVFVAGNITARKEAEEKVSRSLKEKEVLLAEVHHRVKNNLAVISGLLEMQIWNLPEGEQGANALRESQLRIHSMALVHELLYQSETLSEIRLDQFIIKLLDAIEQTHKRDGQSLAISTELQPVLLTIRKAVPVSLLLNELVVNAYKHAFPAMNEGSIAVRLLQDGADIELTVQDNGIGLPPDFDPLEQQTLGMTLMKTLARQIKADLQVESADGDWPADEQREGTRFTVRFKEG